MRQIGLCSRVKRRFVHTTDSNHTMAVAKNLLARDFKADAVNTKWAADITYIPTQQGWLYLAAVMDLYSRRIIGWSMSEEIDSKLVINALRMAILQRKPQAGLVHHSDRGSIQKSSARHSFSTSDNYGYTRRDIGYAAAGSRKRNRLRNEKRRRYRIGRRTACVRYPDADYNADTLRFVHPEKSSEKRIKTNFILHV